MYDPAPEPPATSVAVPGRRVPALERVGAIIEIILCSGFPTQVALLLVLQGFGMTLRTTEGRLSPAFVFTLSLLDAFVVIGLVFFFFRSHREPARAVLLGGRGSLREAAVGIALIPVVFLVVVFVLALILTLAPGLHNVVRNPLQDMLLTRGDALIFGAVVMISGGVREEVQRGFILHRFGTYLGGAGWGVLIYSVFFGLGHLDQGYDAAIATGLLGALWGIVYLARRSIVAPMVSHAGFNVAQLVKYIVVAG